MRPWTTLKIIFFLLAIWAVAVMVEKNASLLNAEFHLVGGYRLPIWWVLLITFVLGLLISVVFMGIQQVEMYLEGWKVKKLKKKLSAQDDLYQRGVGALLDGHLDSADACFTKILENNPDNPLALLRKGRVMRQQGNNETALALHRRAHEIRPEMFEAYLELANDHMAVKDWGKAAQLLKEGLRHDDDVMGEGRTLLLTAYVESGKWDEAEDLYQDMRKDSKRASLFLPKELACIIPYRKALTLVEGKDYKAAIKTLRKIVQKHVEFVPARMALGESLAARGKDEEASTVWCDGYKATGAPIFLARLEDFFLEKEDPARAVETFRRISEIQEDEILPRFFLGKLYLRLEMVDEALKQFRALDSRLIKSPTLHYFLAKVQERRQLYREAVESYKKAIRESDALKLQYCCHHCHVCYETWQDRCAGCGRWNTVDIDLRSELNSSDLSLVSAPVYTPPSEDAKAL